MKLLLFIYSFIPCKSQCLSIIYVLSAVLLATISLPAAVEEYVLIYFIPKTPLCRHTGWMRSGWIGHYVDDKGGIWLNFLNYVFVRISHLHPPPPCHVEAKLQIAKTPSKTFHNPGDITHNATPRLIHIHVWILAMRGMWPRRSRGRSKENSRKRQERKRKEKKSPTPLPLNYYDFHRFTTLSDGFPFLIFAFPEGRSTLSICQLVCGTGVIRWRRGAGISEYIHNNWIHTSFLFFSSISYSH